MPTSHTARAALPVFAQVRVRNRVDPESIPFVQHLDGDAVAMLRQSQTDFLVAVEAIAMLNRIDENLTSGKAYEVQILPPETSFLRKEMNGLFGAIDQFEDFAIQLRKVLRRRE